MARFARDVLDRGVFMGVRGGDRGGLVAGVFGLSRDSLERVIEYGKRLRLCCSISDEIRLCCLISDEMRLCCLISDEIRGTLRGRLIFVWMD